MKKVFSMMLTVFLCLGMVSMAWAADGQKDENYYYFTDRSGNEMMAPKNAFAVRVVSFTPGDPWTGETDNQDPEVTLGLPDFSSSGRNNKNLCLGAGGVLVLGFDTAIYDGESDDIYVFEVGGDVEATSVAVSNDLSTWYEVGDVGGATAGVDLSGKIPEGSTFRYVRLTDLKTSIYSSWPGADIDAVSGLNTTAAYSDWAGNEVKEAEEEDLIPDSLINKDLTLPITRAEFAGVSVKVYENLSNTKALPAVINPFTDTADLDVLKAYNVGVTNGIGDELFAPDSLLNREQCATMLTRVFKRATMPGWTLETDSRFSLSYDQPAPFADDREISGWARDSVYFMAANQIINGIGNNTFAPKNMTPEQEALGYANATREQALAIAVRMVRNLK